MLSIIIPTLNEEKYLPRLLDSIKRQGFSDYEIIVSDAGSEDNTIEIAQKNNCHVIVDRENRHPSFQRNNGAEKARGDILFFLDADTVLSDGFIKVSIDEFKKRNLVSAGFYIKFNPGKKIYSLFSFVFNIFLFFRQYFSPAAVGAGIIAKKEIHDKIGGFDTEITLAEDYEYCRRSAKLGKFRMINSIKILYSSRRLEKEGKRATVSKWLLMLLHTIGGRKIKHKKIKYDLGG